MTDREIHRALERDRLQRRPDAEVRHGPVRTLDICIQDGGIYVTVERELELLISREGLETTSYLSKKLNFECISIEDYNGWPHARASPLTPNNTSTSLQEYEKAKTEAFETIEKFMTTNPKIGISEVKFSPKWLHPEERERGLEKTSVSKTIEYHKGFYMPSLFVWETKLHERGPANANDDPVLIIGPCTERENTVRKAREEIQGALEWFSRREADQRDQLDRGSTNLLEPWVAGGGYCDYCNLPHRNGKCFLP